MQRTPLEALNDKIKHLEGLLAGTEDDEKIIPEITRLMDERTKIADRSPVHICDEIPFCQPPEITIIAGYTSKTTFYYSSECTLKEIEADDFQCDSSLYTTNKNREAASFLPQDLIESFPNHPTINVETYLTNPEAWVELSYDPKKKCMHREFFGTGGIKFGNSVFESARSENGAFNVKCLDGQGQLKRTQDGLEITFLDNPREFQAELKKVYDAFGAEESVSICTKEGVKLTITPFGMPSIKGEMVEWEAFDGYIARHVKNPCKGETVFELPENDLSAPTRSQVPARIGKLDLSGMPFTGDTTAVRPCLSHRGEGSIPYFPGTQEKGKARKKGLYLSL